MFLHQRGVVIGRKSVGFCAVAIAMAMGAWAVPTGASAISQVETYSGPTYDISPYTISTNTASNFAANGTVINGTFLTAFGYPFNYPTTVNTGVTDASSNITLLTNPSNNNYPGTFNLNINTNTPSADFLVEQIDLSYTKTDISDTTPNLTSLFDSTTESGFASVVSGNTTTYYFAFNDPSKAGYIIGGYVSTVSGAQTGDVKTFEFASTPTPSSALGGLALMICLAGWRTSRRIFGDRLASV